MQGCGRGQAILLIILADVPLVSVACSVKLGLARGLRSVNGKLMKRSEMTFFCFSWDSSRGNDGAEAITEPWDELLKCFGDRIPLAVKYRG
jgi:hypothetical protein